MCSSTGGGRYAWLFAPNWGKDAGLPFPFDLTEDAALSGVGGDNDDVEDANEGDKDQSVDETLDAGDWGADEGEFDCGGVDGRSIPSSSESSISISTSSFWAAAAALTASSVDGKKFLNNASACHLEAFLNSTHTSIRPGRESAGSKRSRWFVVLYHGEVLAEKIE